MINRRTFLAGSAAVIASLSLPYRSLSKTVSHVYIAESENISKAVRHAVEMAGGITKYIKPGDVVALKPNMAWAKGPEYAANTNPIVVAEVVKLCFEAKAKEVYVSDNPCNNARSVYSICQIPEYAERMGAKVFIPQNRHYKKMQINGDFVKDWSVFELFKVADKVINIPVLKDHGSSKITASMKNWLGAVGGFRGALHQNLHQAIYDLAYFFNPTLNIIDCSKILIKNGPTGGSLSDVKVLNKIVVTTDQAAGDAVGAEFLGVDVADIDFLKIAQKKGFGNIKKSDIQIAYEKI
jgi:uncharacterized protein (DUF362 family)